MSETPTIPIDQESGPISPIQFISLISRHEKPLYIQAFNIDDNGEDAIDSSNANKFLKYNFLSHMALDIFASPSSLSLREQQQQQQQQQSGKNDITAILLFIQDQVMVYGYETNNGLKIIVGLDQNYITNPDLLSKLFLDIHKCYLRTIFNPLNQINSTTGENDEADILQSPTFDRNIKNLVNLYV